MKIILKKDVETLGYKNDVLKVRDGYARNFLIPRGLADLATESGIKIRNETVRQQAHKAEKILNEANALAQRLTGQIMKVGAKVGESGKIFGSVNTVMISEALKKEGFPIERRQISIHEDTIKTVGTYKATAVLHKDVKVDFEFEVVGE
jgi:large subunit ribosomal protein L9